MPVELQSHSSGGAGADSSVGEVVGAPKFISSCPHLDVNLGGKVVPCLINTGSMVTTITETCFCQLFEPWGPERLQSCHWLELRAANGLTIPYLGYLEVNVELCGKSMPGCGVLVVKDAAGDMRPQVPGVLGMNVIRKCYHELFGQHGTALFDQPVVSTSPQLVVQALQKCHLAGVQAPETRVMSGLAKIRGQKACRIPADITRK